MILIRTARDQVILILTAREHGLNNPMPSNMYEKGAESEVSSERRCNMILVLALNFL